VIVTSDLFYDDRPDVQAEWVAAGARAVEMEAATVLQICSLRGVAGACLLGVTDLLAGGEGRTRIEPGHLDELGVELGRLAMAALSE
jgi:uridine phosphorylase